MTLLWVMPVIEGGKSDIQDDPLKLKGPSVCVVSPLDFREACFSVPAVRALRNSHPDAVISILCPASQSDMWKRVAAAVDHIVEYQGRSSARQIASKLGEADLKFDSAILWEECNAAKAISGAGVAQRLGYGAKQLEQRLTDIITVVDMSGPIQHRVRYYLNLVAQLGADAFVKSSFEVPQLPSAPEKLCVAIAPFSEYGRAYHWPMERIIEVMKVLSERFPDVSWTVFEPVAGSVKASELDEFQALIKEQDLCVQYRHRGDDLYDALAKHTVMLASDGDLAHMAAHVGLPAVVIFGPNAPEWKRPLGKQSIVVRDHVVCSPCFLEKCPLDSRCQTQVTVDMVIDGVEQARHLR